MIELGRDKRQVIGRLCEASKDVLVQGAAEGIAGRVWVPEIKNPAYCLIQQGDFSYLLGISPKGEASMDLRLQLIETCSNDFITPGDERWELWLDENFLGEYRKVSRYALEGETNQFDKDALKRYSEEVPEGVKIKPIDEKLYHAALKEPWSRDFCSGFDSMEHFMKDGMGYVALDGRRIAAGCSAYGRSHKKLEIQVETKEEYRRKGLALACSSKFILACLEKGIFPHWDAANLQSVGLAEKLGYRLDREYTVYQLACEE